MSDLQPKGAPLTLNGEERRLFWDLGVIELVQEAYGQHPIMALESIFWESAGAENKLHFYQAKPVLDILKILLDAEVDREEFFRGKSTLKVYTRKQLGHLIDRSNMDEIVKAIVNSWNEDSKMDELEDQEDGKKKN